MRFTLQFSSVSYSDTVSDECSAQYQWITETIVAGMVAVHVVEVTQVEVGVLKTRNLRSARTVGITIIPWTTAGTSMANPKGLPIRHSSKMTPPSQ